MARQYLSWFAEERKRNNNPNFYDKMDARDLERNVKRIVRDMRNGNIDEQDYIYFSNVRIISACINVSYREMRNANVTVLALQNYNSSYLYNMSMSFPTDDNIMQDRQIATNLINVNANKAGIWGQCYSIFTAIRDGGDVSRLIHCLDNINRDLFRDI